jgi:hypothetical protein
LAESAKMVDVLSDSRSRFKPLATDISLHLRMKGSLPFALVIAFSANHASVLAALKDEPLELEVSRVPGLPNVPFCRGSIDGAPHGLVGSVATIVVLLDELTLELTFELTCELTCELTTERAEDSGGGPRRFCSLRYFLSPTVCELSSSQAISAPNMMGKSADRAAGLCL